MDSKYGRLFTEADVRGMLVEAACDGMNGLAAAGVIADRVLQRYPTAFPADEPLFLLRGQDVFAPDVVGAYAGRVRASQGESEHYRAADQIERTMARWQRANPDRVKVPD